MELLKTRPSTDETNEDTKYSWNFLRQDQVLMKLMKTPNTYGTYEDKTKY